MGWVVGIVLLLLLVSTCDGAQEADPASQRDCTQYATEVAGGEAFRGGPAYNEAYDACERINETSR